MTALSPNALNIEYPDADFYNTFPEVITHKVMALPDDTNQVQNLSIGASSNVIIEARETVDIHIKPLERLNMFSTYVDEDDVRHETKFMEVGASNDSTIITGVNNKVQIVPQDAGKTVQLGQLTCSESTTSQLISTSKDEIKVLSDMSAMGNMSVSGTLYSTTITADNMVVDKNLTVKNQGVQGSMFGNNMNMYVNLPNSNVNEVNRIGYGFFINSNNEQLELFKYKRYNKLTGSNIDVDGKKQYVKIARFGYGVLPYNSTTNLADVSIFDTLEHLFIPTLGGGDGSSNLSSSGSNSSFWRLNSDANIYYIGNVGVSMSNPQYPLDVNGIINSTGLYVNGAPYVASQWKTTSQSNIYISASNVGIGTSNPTSTLDVDGTITSTNTITAKTYVTASDSRIKENFVRLNNFVCLESINKLHPYQYDLKPDSKTKLGFIAQEVAEVIPFSIEVKPNPSVGIQDFNYLDYNSIIASLVGAVQELDRKVNTLFGSTRAVRKYF